MRRISYVRSLMEFNTRVLEQGSINTKQKYSISELKNKLFFNKIFLSNMEEIFNRHNFDKIELPYRDKFSMFIHNINDILIYINKLNSNNRIFLDESNFDHRMSIQRLAAPYIQRFHVKSLKDINYNFDDNQLYYLVFKKNKMDICTIDSSLEIYHKPIVSKINNGMIFCKTDKLISEYLSNNKYNVTTIRVTHNRKNLICKVEFNNPDEICDELDELFPYAIKLYNPFIYLNDFDQILDIINDVHLPEYIPSVMNTNISAYTNHDVMIEYPNNSFNDFIKFLKDSINTNNVDSMYITLYRIGTDPTLYDIMKQAISKGIKVHINIELCATGELEINTFWKNELLRIGVSVSTYAVGKHKVHCKLALIEFRNQSYICQIGTGNYHTKNVLQYTDLSLFTSDERICKDAKKLFKVMSGNIKESDIKFSKSFLVTRFNMMDVFIKLIDEQAQLGSDGLIIFKCNALDDDTIIYHLNQAAIRGCKIYLIVRGVCTWIPEYSNVVVKSIVWTKLEHSRMYSFGKSNPTIYLGSLDLVTNKIRNRIETLCRINDVNVLKDACKYLNRYVRNSSESWIQTITGEYIKEE